MKLAEFNALCDREWAKQDHGDVQALRLTADSLRELVNDVLLSNDFDSLRSHLVLSISAEEVSEIRAGAALREIVNPVTRSAVKLSGTSAEDTATVHTWQGDKVVALA